jgi:hypothetical protein
LKEKVERGDCFLERGIGERRSLFERKELERGDRFLLIGNWREGDRFLKGRGLERGDRFFNR